MKKILMACLLVVSSFFMFGCFKDDDTTKDDGKIQTMTKEEFYEKLTVLSTNIQNVKKYTVYSEISGSMFLVGEQKSFDTTTVDLENNKYAYVSKDANGKVTNSEYVLKVEDDFVSYQYDSGEATVDDEYSSYLVGSDYIQAIMGVNIPVDGLIATSYEDFAKYMESIFYEFIDEAEMGETTNLQTANKIYKENGVYAFVTTASVKGSEAEGLFQGAIMDVDAKLEFKFTEEYIKEVNIEYKAVITMNQDSMTISISSKSSYSKGFKNEVMISDFSAYPSEATPKEFIIECIIDGDEDSSYTEYDEYQKGETFVLDYDEYLIQNTTFDGWYLDKNYTVSANTLTEYPSYDLTLYAKIKPNENYGLIILKGALVSGDYWTFSIDVEKFAIGAGVEYIIPETVETWGMEGNVVSVKVNGVEYTKETIVIENQKIYVVEVEAVKV